VAGACDIAIRVPDGDTPLIQEVHLAVVHVLCDLIEAAFATPGGR